VAQPVAAPAASGSTVNVLLPQLGESVTEGTITRWLKNVGDKVSIDEAIVEISTDKVDTEIPSPSAGVISEIRVAQDQVALVGAILAVISTAQVLQLVLQSTICSRCFNSSSSSCTKS
jgi:pyruvate dehydrogenase E2 component (dihydrolipoamide acetyltransferase)